MEIIEKNSLIFCPIYYIEKKLAANQFSARLYFWQHKEYPSPEISIISLVAKLLYNVIGMYDYYYT